MKARGYNRSLGRVARATLAMFISARGSDESLPDVYAELSVPRSRVYVHQVFPLTLRLHVRQVQLAPEVSVTGLFQDGWITAAGAFQELEPQRVRQGVRYVETRRFVCDVRAIAPGTVTLAPRIQGAVLERRYAFFGIQWTRVSVTIPVNPLALTVVPLPETGRPPDFSGAVGEFSLDVEVSPRDVTVGDLITVRMVVRGKGWLDPAVPPRLVSTEGFKVYDPKSVAGTRRDEWQFEQTLVALSSNMSAVSAVVFHYFDPAAEAYRVCQRGPFSLRFHAPEVPPSEGAASSTVMTRPSFPPETRVGGERKQENWRQRLRRWLSQWRDGTWGSAGYVLKNATKGRLAPGESALPTFDVEAGETVYVVERAGDWVKVAHRGNRGWIPVEALDVGAGNPEGAADPPNRLHHPATATPSP